MKDNYRELLQETKEIWNQNAVFWDEQMGEGNLFHRALIDPAVERLLNLQPGAAVLEVACGNGSFSRRLAQQGMQVVASDFSEVFIERAKARPFTHAERLEYRVIDATSEAQLLALGERRFDAAVCNQGIMDMVEIQPLLNALGKVLKVGGCFVFTVMHPCFNGADLTMVAEVCDSGGGPKTVYSVKTSRYKTWEAKKGIGMAGQPAAHYLFHRPISVLFSACFQAGFVLDGIEEPAFVEEQENSPGSVSWRCFTEIPPILAARMRLPH